MFVSSRRLIQDWLLSLLVLSTTSLCCLADVVCRTDDDCVAALLDGSECVNGLCTNPFYRGGCLHRMVEGGYRKVRTCSSDDPPEAIENGYCRPSPLGYQEVRISTENWENAYFGVWILQILLGEILDVPTTVESGTADVNLNLYEISSSFGYGGIISDFEALKTGFENKDCTKLTPRRQGDDYRSCSHVIPEYWANDLPKGNDHLELHDLGCLTSADWFVPKFTAERDSTLVSYFGLSGEHNRRKLADAFHRPTTWEDYCQYVSRDNCTTSDGVATRPPADETERASYFVEGEYIGHFRATEKNDCDRNPDTCTGHIMVPSCDWGVNVIPYTYHLNIALESDGKGVLGGYEHEELLQIWLAANATKANIIAPWWTPDIWHQIFVGTDMEFVAVILPYPTQNCVKLHAVEPYCDWDVEMLRGNANAACGFPKENINKVISKAIKDTLSDNHEELWSPAYQAVVNYKITEVQLGQITDYWQETKVDTWNFDPRRAACRWVVENLDLVKSWIPSSHPRIVEVQKFTRTPLLISGLVLSALVIVLLCASCIATRLLRSKKAICHTQEEIIYAILCGLMFLSTAAMILALPPSEETCVAFVWTANLGYCLAFVAFLTRISAISKILQSGKRMQRARLEPRGLYGWLGASLCLVVAFLILWTVHNAPGLNVKYTLTEQLTENDEFVVKARSHCGVEFNLWLVLSLIWRGLLLIFSLMIAYTALMVRDDVNDTRELAAALLLHMIFFLVWVAFVVFGNESMDPVTLSGMRSIILSVECLASLALYIAPKLVQKQEDSNESNQDPDLFIDTSILVADIAGFSAWSSVREPGQVFKFLRTIYGAFDDIAEKRKVFKVDTTGDCYVAAAGIPRAHPDHALVLARFACDCASKMRNLCHELEVIFGPDTGNLTLRIGIHSGPVTGGFLKDQGGRFQLFGDTMNIATQLARSCDKDRIQLSEQSAELIRRHGKDQWLQERQDLIVSDGKSLERTYWLIRADKSTLDPSAPCETSSERGSEMGFLDEDYGESRHARLVDWNVEVLHQLLKLIMAKRSLVGSQKTKDPSASCEKPVQNLSLSLHHTDSSGASAMPLDEVKEIILLPEFDRRAATRQKDSDLVAVPDIVLEQLKFFVATIAQMYNDNPFHNFSHASHVVMAVTKFMNRINEARDLHGSGDDKDRRMNGSKFASALHDHTYGITSDPLTQFACVFSALIHDVDHPGVPNLQLIKENETLASMYRYRSVAEQNSFDLAWNLLMDSRFNDLRATLAPTPAELIRFRQIVINSIMATDLGDKELKELRNKRWEKAFQTGFVKEEECSTRDSVNRKATIVVEHLIQAADVSHTTQHWEVYRMWNENLFRELYKAYRHGRAETNPADIWYEGEIGFFDYYIIPLARKLRDCGVFGLTSDENLNYALRNRQLWVEKGVTIVAEMLERAQKEFDAPAGK